MAVASSLPCAMFARPVATGSYSFYLHVECVTGGAMQSHNMLQYNDAHLSSRLPVDDCWAIESPLSLAAVAASLTGHESIASRQESKPACLNLSRPHGLN